VTADPFTVLGLPVRPDLTDDDVRSAWRRIAAATHPDRPDGGDPDRYAVAGAAYTELRTPSGRGEAHADLAAGNPWRPRPRRPVPAAQARAATADTRGAPGPSGAPPRDTAAADAGREQGRSGAPPRDTAAADTRGAQRPSGAPPRDTATADTRGARRPSGAPPRDTAAADTRGAQRPSGASPRDSAARSRGGLRADARGAGALAARIRRGRPALLALRVAITVGVCVAAFGIVGAQPAAAGLATGALTWFLLTARHDLMPPGSE
jgi:curved DNA-binding protein CbpA